MRPRSVRAGSSRAALASLGGGLHREGARGEAVAEPRAAGLANGSFTADLNGFRIHYEVHGQGPVLMALTNSWGLSLEALRAMYRPLEEKLTLVYFDPRGMGGSGPVREESDRGLAAVRADFQALRAHLKLEKVNAIGWSNGAINLIWLAHEHPETLSSAIFVHGMASLGPEDMKAMQAQHPELMKKYGALMAAVSKPGLSRRRADRPAAEDVARGLLPDPLRRSGEGQGPGRRGVPRRPAELAARRATRTRRCRPSTRGTCWPRSRCAAS